jgi:hypothetical protein
LQQKGFSRNKITKFKHQITNKSQIKIFNDQNIHQRCMVLLRLPMSVGDDAIGPTVDGLFVWPASSSSVVS